MTTRTIGMALVCILLAAPALASGLADAIAREAAQAPRRPASRDDNRYAVPGWALIGGGGTVLLIGLTHATGAECHSTLLAFDCRTTKSTGVIVGGAAAAGLGAFLLMKGERERDRPQIVPLAGGIGVRHRIRW